MATRLLLDSHKVHLLICHAPYLVCRNSVVSRVDKLIERFGRDKVKPHFINIMPLAGKIIFGGIGKDLSEDRSVCACIGCKLSMHASAIRFNIKHGIKTTMTGNVRNQTYDQSDLVSHAVEEIYLEAGQRLMEPIWESGSARSLTLGENWVRKAQIKLMREEGIITSSGPLESQRRFLGSQPFCLLGKSAWVLAGFSQKRLTEHSQDYLDRKIPRLREMTLS